MTKKLEELFDLPPMEGSDNEEIQEETATKEELMIEADTIINALTNSEKVDAALTSVTGLVAHDGEMDDIANRAIKSYEDLCDLGLNVPDMHVGKVYEVAATMLKTAMEAKDAKVNRKLKMIDLQLKKLRVDKIDNPDGSSGGTHSVEFDRNELLKHIVSNQKSDTSDK